MYIQLTLRESDRDHSPTTYVKFYEIEQITPRADKTPGCRVHLVSGRVLDVTDTADSLIGEPEKEQSAEETAEPIVETDIDPVYADLVAAGTEDAVKEATDPGADQP